ncbi:MAG: VCBS repeat-containing protein [Candidatus Sumerlaeia bacterium]|nr:VCBS repeat-containing protein [Candidatus Sumerlaeia bacterium]
MRRARPCAVALTLLLSGALFAQPEPRPTPAPSFRLASPQLYEGHRRASQLTIADLNGDGHLDIAVVANDEGLLRILYRNPDKAAAEPFRLEKITLDRVVNAMVAADVNGDGRMDLVLAGTPPSFSVMYQSSDGRLQKAETKDLQAERLVLGDLTGTGKQDLLLVSGRRMRLLPATTRGISLEPSQTFFASDNLAESPLILDLDGDGRNDIVYRPASSNEFVVARLQSPEGDFPFEVALRTGQVRALDVLPQPRAADHLAAIHGTTRQLAVMTLQEPLPEEERGALTPGLPHVLAFDPDSLAERSIAVVADIDGDGRADLLVATPGAPSLRYLRQGRTGGLRPRQVPALEDIRGAVAWPAASGKPAPVLLMSSKEKAVAVARVDPRDPGNLQFPDPLPIKNHPLGIGLARLQPNAAPGLVIVEREDRTLRLVAYPGFDPAQTKLPDPVVLMELGERRDPPEHLVVIDFNGDGVDELLLLFEFDKPLVLERHDGAWREMPLSGLLAGLLDKVRPQHIFPVRLDPKAKPAVMIVKEQFGRVFRLDAAGQVEILHQFNARNNRSRLVAATAGSLRGRPMREVALYDRTNRIVSVFGADSPDSAYELLSEIDVGDAQFDGLHALDLDGDGRDDLVLLGSDRLSVVGMQPTVGSLQTVASIQTTTEEGGFGIVRRIALDKAGAPLLAALEMRENALEMFSLERPRRQPPALQRAYSFRVFDSEASVARRVNLDAPPEPREIATADLDGDGLPDLVVLVHDKIIIYPQRAR